ncbi:MAG: SMI1/KNR4 family protein [Leptolyngbya sp. RL_3_1]|nr:SMI1/KNR4 family protein [Leptolyngbya sp. RL_3_1]
MSEKALKKLNEIFSKVKITREILHSEISTEEDIFELESRLNLRFPEGYKEFCRFFGSGYFGKDWICIDVPKRGSLEKHLRSNHEIIDAYKMGIEDDLDAEDSEKSALISLLERSWIFGFGNQTLFLFSQENSEEQDPGCKIYAFNYDLNLYDLGQNFFDFLRGFCLGDGMARGFSQLISSMVPLDQTIDQIRVKTFTPLYSRG